MSYSIVPISDTGSFNTTVEEGIGALAAGLANEKAAFSSAMSVSTS